jgi:hypothetical protein
MFGPISSSSFFTLSRPIVVPSKKDSVAPPKPPASESNDIELSEFPTISVTVEEEKTLEELLFWEIMDRLKNRAPSLSDFAKKMSSSEGGPSFGPFRVIAKAKPNKGLSTEEKAPFLEGVHDVILSCHGIGIKPDCTFFTKEHREAISLAQRNKVKNSALFKLVPPVENGSFDVELRFD